MQIPSILTCNEMQSIKKVALNEVLEQVNSKPILNFKHELQLTTFQKTLKSPMTVGKVMNSVNTTHYSIGVEVFLTYV